MLHMISTCCAARDLHTIAPGPLERSVGDSSQRSEEIVKKSQIAPLNAIFLLLSLLLLYCQWLSCQEPGVLGQRWNWFPSCPYTVTS